ncbi:Alkaline phosphatase [Yarrowia sp. C11]|nr:Alkaline phosphatase [Yarrowia sp. C11]KAG5364321.1 Alkaline phosphatase [Yarrowia sp. E02]
MDQKTDSREYLDGFKAGQKVAYERLYWRRILVLFGGLAMVLGFFGYKGYVVSDVLDLDLSLSRVSTPDVPLVAPLSKPKKNVIFMVTDGMGPASVSLARTYRQYVQGLAFNNTLTIDKHFIGSSRTRSSDSPVTDSAAGATAFSCGAKSYNGAISVTPDYKACGSVLEAAKRQGLKTGLVVTTRITDATPACFGAHVAHRSQEDEIADQLLGYATPLGRSVDLLMGGGRIHFTTKGRQDGRDLIAQAQIDGFQYIANRQEFDELDTSNASLPLLALFTDYDMPYEIDRIPEQFPSLKETAVSALEILHQETKDSDEGFFIMIEGSRIDHAGHQNDPAAQVREVMAFDEMFAAVVDFADSLDTETIIVSTSDHETGGLATARQVEKAYPEYNWFPEALANAKHSGEFVARKLQAFARPDHPSEASGSKLEKFIKREILENDLGVKDYTKHEVKALIKNRADPIDTLVDIVSRRSQTGWSTHGHSAVDVNIYGYSNKQSGLDKLDALRGNHENIEIGQFLASYLEVDVARVTEILEDLPVRVQHVEEIDDCDQYHHGLY